MSKINYRTDSITMEQAQKAFDDYYKKNTTSEVGRFRAKLYDKMYQKKDNFTLREGEPGSARYLLPKGPKTFDFVGVDWFPEGEEFIVEKENPTKYKSKGATYKPGSDDNASEVYGPRLKDNQKLYCDYFRKEYEDNVSKTGKRDWLVSHKKNKKSGMAQKKIGRRQVAEKIENQYSERSVGAAAEAPAAVSFSIFIFDFHF